MGLRLGIPNKLPADADAAGLRTRGEGYEGHLIPGS